MDPNGGGIKDLAVGTDDSLPLSDGVVAEHPLLDKAAAKFSCKFIGSFNCHFYQEILKLQMFMVYYYVFKTKSCAFNLMPCICISQSLPMVMMS